MGLLWLTPGSFSKAEVDPMCPRRGLTGFQGCPSPWQFPPLMDSSSQSALLMGSRPPWHSSLGTTAAYLPPALGLIQVAR